MKTLGGFWVDRCDFRIWPIFGPYLAVTSPGKWQTQTREIGLGGIFQSKNLPQPHMKWEKKSGVSGITNWANLKKCRFFSLYFAKNTKIRTTFRFSVKCENPRKFWKTSPYSRTSFWIFCPRLFISPIWPKFWGVQALAHVVPREIGLGGFSVTKTSPKLIWSGKKIRGIRDNKLSELKKISFFFHYISRRTLKSGRPSEFPWFKLAF